MKIRLNRNVLFLYHDDDVNRLFRVYVILEHIRETRIHDHGFVRQHENVRLYYVETQIH